MGASGSTDGKQYAIPVGSSGIAGSSPIYRNINSQRQLVTAIDGVQTLYENFLCGVAASAGSGDGPCLGERDGKSYKWMSYKEVQQNSRYIGSTLHTRYKLYPQSLVGIYSRNSAAWVTLEQACNAYSLVTVPLYDTLGSDAVEYIIRTTEMRTIACTRDKTKSLLALADKCPTMCLIIELDGLPQATSIVEKGVEIISLSTLQQIGKTCLVDPIPPKPTDLATIVFTSGTTGDPKGAMITHANFAAVGAGAAGGGVDMYNTDVHISYLPLAHVFERIVQLCVIHRGASIGFFSGDVQKLLEDMAVLQPTVFPSVPRLFNRVYDKVMAGVNAAPPFRKALFDFALGAKTWYLKSGGHVTHTLHDKIVFSKLRALMGGRVRLMITGSAPIAPAVKDFLQVAFCAPVLEGYGLTETCGLVSLSPTDARSLPGVGCPVTTVEVRLDDIPEMGYLHTDKPYPRGEICVRGPTVFVGYYKARHLTDEAIDAQGWFHTGDVGKITEKGILEIFDRKKNIFKLSQGEYVAAEKIENVYARSPYVAQAFVYGDSLKSCLVGVIVPDPDLAQQWASDHKTPFDLPTLCASNPAFLETVQESMSAAAREAGLKGFELVKAIHLEPNAFTVENNLLTPTFKLKRQQLKDRYAATINEMYDALGEK